MAIEALRAHAAPGSNGIAAILLQEGGDGVTALIHGAIAKVWRKGEAPATWKDVGLLAFYTGKGHRLQGHLHHQHRGQGLCHAAPPPPSKGHRGEAP